MRLFRVEGWLESPLDRDVIHRWTLGGGSPRSHRLSLPDPPDPNNVVLLALGDTGDSEAAGPYLSPQDAVAQQMERDCLPESGGVSALLHMGDVVYMTGEKRCYERNFRRPYHSFLAPQSTVDELVFNLPFLPVPGNHDYYDLGVWARFLARLPFLGRGVRALTHQLFEFSIPLGGSGMGGTFMQAFVQQNPPDDGPLAYIPGSSTRIPNRYYQTSLPGIDIFALDSNTLDAPPPGADPKRVQRDASEHLRSLEKRADELEKLLRKDQRALDKWRISYHNQLVQDPGRLTDVRSIAAAAGDALHQLIAALERLPLGAATQQAAVQAAFTAERRWNEAKSDLEGAAAVGTSLSALQALDDASDTACDALDVVEQCLSNLPESSDRTAILGAQHVVETALHRWSSHVSQAPADLLAGLRKASEEALDVQRELAQEKRRLRYRPDDYDSAQMEWLDRALSESMRDRPGAWRVVFLHHPLYTTISNHCERPDILGLRENLLGTLQGRVDVLLSGHAHTFEWLRSDALPNTAIFVTGGGGALSLRPSLMDPQRFGRYRERYDSLRRAGVVECAVAGRGPFALDGESGYLYHYLRLEVTPAEIVIRPVGVRRLAAGYRREQPLPAFHSPRLEAGPPEFNARLLECVRVRRDAPPTAEWVDNRPEDPHDTVV